MTDAQITELYRAAVIVERGGNPGLAAELTQLADELSERLRSHVAQHPPGSPLPGADARDEL